MIETLFGSKTRVKLLGLFMNNPGRSFYVREIARNIDEQLNSVRRELANLVSIGIINDNSVDNRLYYQVDPKFRFYKALREMFLDSERVVSGAIVEAATWRQKFASLEGVETVVFAGALVYASDSPLDLIVAGNQVDQNRLKVIIKALERESGASLNYTILNSEELFYRLSVRDRFVLDVLESNHLVVLDETNLLKKYSGSGGAEPEKE